MELAKSFSYTEILLGAVFIALYLLYILRVIRTMRSLKQRTGSFVYKLALRSLYFGLILIAFLMPTFGKKTIKEIKAKGKDIYLLVDISKSMDANDIQPSRLEKVKYQLKSIVKAFSSDRIGLIVFSSDAFLQCPLTFDNSALFLFIETMRTGLTSATGTDFYPALKMALEKLSVSDKNTAQKTSKLILLISDGEDFGEETTSIADEIEQNDIKLFTLGVGTEEGGRIPEGTGYKRDKEGKEVITRLKSEPLKKLADMTGGKYFEISDKRNDINRLIQAINQIEGETLETQTIQAADNKYYYFLATALFLMVLDVLFTVKLFRI
ncbi:MAG: VWA domain-containing protein [Cytophagales bacterium]|nr:VWA domain-containing protein [Cytophagales bacterium]MDW8384758.1 VWA domain-containing protein [Flammeovirgaceae bacterium]